VCESLKPNVVIIVLDTLREDFALRLSLLRDYGFTKYANAIAAASWTLPSHVSMFTGLLPSIHGVHEGDKINILNISQLSRKTLTNLSENGTGMFKLMRDQDYTTYCLTSNVLVSPHFGFKFDFYRNFDAHGDQTDNFDVWSPDTDRIRRSVAMLKRHKFALLAKMIYDDQVKRNVSRILGKGPLEKGSRYIIETLSNLKLTEPFFLFVNLMEAHPPYSWTDRASKQIQFDSVIGVTNRHESRWAELYPLHSELAVSRALHLMELLKPFFERSLVIVTSDHGQLLGERGRFDHGYFLDDELLKVPLYVRYPEGWEPLPKSGPLISLLDVALIVRDVVYREKNVLGSEVAFAESFGSPWNLKVLVKNQVQQKKIEAVYSRRIRVKTSTASATYNVSKGSVEDIKGEISSRRVEELVSSLLKNSGTSPDVYSFSEDQEMIRRLKDIGYI
jgi:predicted AlkP superfamily pyrophosphatase or phosphodiesterase